MTKPIILTGLRANGEFHLGNYLGAILPMVGMQQKHAGGYQLNMFVPDLHSFTTPIEHGSLYQQSLDNLRLYAAVGLDISNKNTFIYRQSYIPAHAELAWILDCFTSYGELSRMTQFKEKAEGKDTVSVGLFNYPVLMAADILLYGATYVPLGDDQKQHLELARDLGIRLNNRFGEDLFTLPLPWKKQLEFMNLDAGIRIRSLRNPDKKMSKSVSDPAGTIMLSDAPEEAAKKIMGATTDSEGAIHYDMAKQPGISNLLTISALLQHKAVEDVAKEWDGQNNYGELKKQVAELVSQFLTDLQTDYAAVDTAAVQSKLVAGENAMQKTASATLLKVQRAVGLRPKSS
jgi:tryptophanyl-tRNA synthetase